MQWEKNKILIEKSKTKTDQECSIINLVKYKMDLFFSRTKWFQIFKNIFLPFSPCFHIYSNLFSRRIRFMQLGPVKRVILLLKSKGGKSFTCVVALFSYFWVASSSQQKFFRHLNFESQLVSFILRFCKHFLHLSRVPKMYFLMSRAFVTNT